jgi:co-chaperonin GroES (HSP10)
MHFRPLHDRVLVRRIEAEQKTAGGIFTRTQPAGGCLGAAGQAPAGGP